MPAPHHTYSDGRIRTFNHHRWPISLTVPQKSSASASTVFASECQPVTVALSLMPVDARGAGASPLERLSRRDSRVTNPSDFARILARRQRLFSRFMCLNMIANNGPHPRLGMNVKRRMTVTAIQRNLLRRCLSEQFRLRSGNLPKLDMVVTLRARCTKPSQARQAAREFSQMLDNLPENR